MTVAPESVGRRIPFKFLNELQNKFSSSYDTDDIEDMSAYSLSEFNPTLEKVSVMLFVIYVLKLI